MPCSRFASPSLGGEKAGGAMLEIERGLAVYGAQIGLCPVGPGNRLRHRSVARAVRFRRRRNLAHALEVGLDRPNSAPANETLLDSRQPSVYVEYERSEVPTGLTGRRESVASHPAGILL